MQTIRQIDYWPIDAVRRLRHMLKWSACRRCGKCRLSFEPEAWDTQAMSKCDVWWESSDMTEQAMDRCPEYIIRRVESARRRADEWNLSPEEFAKQMGLRYEPD